jgi:hypothetical protein
MEALERGTTVGTTMGFAVLPHEPSVNRCGVERRRLLEPQDLTK